MLRLIAMMGLAIGFLSSCKPIIPVYDPESIFDDPKAYVFSAELVDIIRAKDVEAFLAKAHPEAATIADIEDQVHEFFSYFPPENDFEVALYYAELRHGESEYAGTPIYFTAYDVHGSNGYAQMLLAVAPNEGECCVTTFWRVTPMKSRPSTVNAFTLEGKRTLHYVMFALLIGLPVFTVITAIACGLNPSVGRKWLWIPFILVGLWGVHFNWTTGALQNALFLTTDNGVQFQLFSFHLLSAGFVKYGVFEPWIITISIPLGAILYWLGLARRRKS